MKRNVMTIRSPYQTGRQPCRRFRPIEDHDPERCPHAKCGKRVYKCQGCLKFHHEGGQEICAGS
jgi:hypothetical protein